MPKPAWIFMLLVYALAIGRIYGQGSGKEADLPLRVEIPAGSDEETYKLLPCGPDNLVLFYKSLEVTPEGQVKWYIACYDRNLQRTWVKGVPLFPDMEYSGYKLMGDTLALWFLADSKSRSSVTRFQLARVPLKKGNVVLNNGEVPFSADLAGFDISGPLCVAGFNLKSALSQMMFMDLKTGKVDAYPIGSGGTTAFVDLRIDPSSLNVKAVMLKRLTKRFWDQFFVTIGTDGKVHSETLISTINPDRVLNRSEIAEISQDRMLIGGTYLMANSVSEPQAGEKWLNKATGFYMTGFFTEQQKTLFFYNFLDLTASKNILSERDVLNVKKKAMKKTTATQEASSDLNVLLHKLLEHNGVYYLVGETYIPEYHTETFTDFDFYGRPFTNTYSVFDGYRFTNVIITAFDSQGQRLWDNSMEIRNLVSKVLEPKSVIWFTGDNIVLAYLNEGKVASKIIHEGTVTGKTEYNEVDLSAENERLAGETKPLLQSWYDRYFIASGYQEIKSIASGGNGGRLVFYFTKLQFEQP